MSRIALAIELLAFSALSAFSGALLFITFVIVKFWQSLEPQAYLDWMSAQFFRFPILMVPLNMIALVLLMVSLGLSWRTNPQHRLPLGLGVLLLLACTLTFPIYFAGANAESVNQTLPLNAVTDHLTIWSSWNWIRTGLAGLAVISTGTAIIQPQGAE